MNKYIYILGIMFFYINTFSQTGPGGVGSSSSNLMWFKSEDISALADGDDVMSWLDASGNSNNVSQPNSSFTPIYKTGVLNGFPAVRFQKTNGRLRRTGFTTFPTNTITAIYVNSTIDTGDGVLSYASSSSNNDFLLFSSNSLRLYRNSNVNSVVSFNDGNFHITNASWQSIGGNVEIWKDGSRDFTGTVSSGTSITAGGSFAIAGEQDAVDANYDPNQAHFGDFTEVMLFNTVLNEAQNIIIANYLGAKYEISIANDRFAYQDTHSKDVAGIGRENSTNTHLSAMSNGVLKIQNASGLDADQEYLLFGHDGEDIITTWTTTETPDAGVDIQRLSREWRLDETGDVGDVDFVVDVATFPALPVGHTMYTLMVDTDGDFGSGADVYEMTLVSGTEYTVTGVNISDGDYVAIAAVNPKIQHTVTNSSGNESSNAVIEVSLNFIPQTNKTVTYTTTNVTAISGSDYTAATSEIATILAGNTSSTYTVFVTDDTDLELTESFTSILSSPSSGITLGANTALTYSILDDDITRKVYFDVATNSNNESTTSVTVNLSLNVADAVNPTSVDYTVVGGTATGGGTDFTLSSGTVNFAAGSTNEIFTFSVNNDVLNENNETIIIELSNPTNCNLDSTIPFGGTGFVNYTYTINDDDIVPTMQFTNATSSGSETVSSVNFEVNIDGVSGIDATTNYTVTGGSATSDVDFILSSGTIVIPAGSTTANINAIINDDVEVELNETFTVNLIAPTNNAILGTNTTHTYTILDDESFGYTGPGGVGGTTTNIFWLDSDSISSLSDDDDLVSWSDVSGNSNTFSQSATFSPIYKTNVVNGFPAARFNKTNNRIRKTNFNAFASTAATAIFVNKNNGESEEAHLSYAAGGSGGNDFLLFNSSNLQLYVNSTNTTTGVSLNDNNWHIINASWQSSGGNYEIWKDGIESATGTISSGATIASGGTLAIAGEQDSVDGSYVNSQAHSGDYPEVIMYNVYLNTAQQIIVANYLSAKYDITIANDFYDQDDTGNGDYDFNVAGIGRATDNSFHADSQGNGIVRILNPSSLDNDDYLFWGRNNKTNYSFTTNTSNYKERISSNWRVSKRNDVGLVTVAFDMAGIDLSNKQSCAALQLVVDNDSDLLSPSATYTLINTSGTIYEATGVSFADGDYFTLEYQDVIVLDGTQFYNGSGTLSAPNTSDDCYKLLVKNTATGTLALTENANVRELDVENGGKLVVASEKGLQVTNGINLNGEIRLIDKSQLIQTHSGTSQITGTGNLYIDQDSEVSSLYLYNYFSSPVSTLGASNYTVASVMKDGTIPTDAASIPLDINYITGLDGNFTGSPIEIADRWIYTYDDIGGGTYAYDNNGGVGSTKIIDPGKGYLFKGPGRAQNYTFMGTPNDGTYTYSGVPANVNVLVGNPYPSALNVQEFLSDNSAVGTTIYLWQQAGVDNAESALGHFRSGYNGGYATINTVTSVAATLPSQIDYIRQAEDAVLSGTATVVGDKVLVSSASDEISFEFIGLSKSVNSLFIVYSSTASKPIDIDVNGVSELIGVVLPSTAGVLVTHEISSLNVAPEDIVTLKSTNATPIEIDNVFARQQYTFNAPPFDYLTVGQGFFFFVENMGSIEFNNSQRAFVLEGTSGSILFKRHKKQENISILKLGMDFSPVENQVFHKQIAISFKDGNSFGYDRGYDSKIQGVQATDMYFRFPEDENAYIIAGVQEITNSLEIPLEIVIENPQTIRIGIDEIKDIDIINKGVYLKDTETGISYDLSKESAEIKLESGIYKSRFFITFKESSVLTTKEHLLSSSFVIKHNREIKQLSIKNNGNAVLEKVSIYTLLGQKRIEIDEIHQLNKKEIVLKTKALKNTIYIVSLKTSEGKITKKFF